MVYDTFIGPFAEFEFMRRALAGTLALALGAGPIGVFLMLRRMSLVGDAMAHAILPGAAVGFLLSGLNLFAMTAGGLIAGFVVAVLTGLVARTTELKEDAALATFYLLSLAIGVPRARGTQSGERISCARHLAGGGHDDAAGGDRPFLGPRCHADDADRDRQRPAGRLRRLVGVVSLRYSFRPRGHPNCPPALPPLPVFCPRRR